MSRVCLYVVLLCCLAGALALALAAARGARAVQGAREAARARARAERFTLGSSSSGSSAAPDCSLQREEVQQALQMLQLVENAIELWRTQSRPPAQTVRQAQVLLVHMPRQVLQSYRGGRLSASTFYNDLYRQALGVGAAGPFAAYDEFYRFIQSKLSACAACDKEAVVDIIEDVDANMAKLIMSSFGDKQNELAKPVRDAIKGIEIANMLVTEAIKTSGDASDMWVQLAHIIMAGTAYEWDAMDFVLERHTTREAVQTVSAYLALKSKLLADMGRCVTPSLFTECSYGGYELPLAVGSITARALTQDAVGMEGAGASIKSIRLPLGYALQVYMSGSRMPIVFYDSRACLDQPLPLSSVERFMLINFMSGML